MLILLLAALPQEYGSFKRRCGPWTLLARRPFRWFSGDFSGKQLFLVETGMGGSRMAEAMEWAYGKCRPDLILAMGFAGSLCGDLAVGDVLLGRESVLYDHLTGSAEAERFLLTVPETLIRCFKARGVTAGMIVTVRQPQSKAAMAGCFAGSPAVTDMETHVAARFAWAAGAPFLCFRSVSDGLNHEIDYDLNAITDSEGRVQVLKVMGAVLRRPGLLRSFALSWRRSLKAANRLGEALCDFLNLPLPTLLNVAGECRVGCRRGDGNS